MTLPELPEMPELPELPEELTALVENGFIIQPGDTVLFTVPHKITGPEAAALKTNIKAELPGITPVILSGGIQVSAIYREGPSDE